jgi:hypothetical protein
MTDTIIKTDMNAKYNNIFEIFYVARICSGLHQHFNKTYARMLPAEFQELPLQKPAAAYVR